MSDWKSRAKKVEAGGAGSWRERAKPIATLQSEPIETEDPGLLIIDGRDPAMGEAAAALQGAAQGATFGAADEIAGAIDVPLETSKYLMQKYGGMPEDERISDEIRQPGVRINGREVAPPSVVPDSGREDFDPVDVYRKSRDSYRAIDKRAADAHPGIHLAGEVAGIVASPTGWARAPVAVTKLGRAALGAVQAAKVGGAFAAGNSEADLTRGEVSEFVGDVEDGAALSAPIGVVGGVVAGRYADKAAKAQADALALKEKAAQQAFASARGALGGETSAGARTLEHLQRIIQDEGVDPALRQEAIAFLQSEGGVALRDRVLGNAVLRGKDQLGRIEGAQQGFNEAAAAKTPDAVARSAEEFLAESTLKKDVAPRLWNYLQRWLPQELSNLAGGGDVGKVAGTVVGAQMGAPGTSAANMMRNPRFRYKTAGALGAMSNFVTDTAAGAVGGHASEKLSGVLNGGINPALFSSKYGPALEEAKGRGDKALAVMHFLNMTKDPEYRALATQSED